jgi:lipid-binding SYLF domain-containing protein
LLKGKDAMNVVKILAIVLIVAGGLGLAYGSFSYTKETHKAAFIFDQQGLMASLSIEGTKISRIK